MANSVDPDQMLCSVRPVCQKCCFFVLFFCFLFFFNYFGAKFQTKFVVYIFLTNYRMERNLYVKLKD